MLLLLSPVGSDQFCQTRSVRPLEGVVAHQLPRRLCAQPHAQEETQNRLERPRGDRFGWKAVEEGRDGDVAEPARYRGRRAVYKTDAGTRELRRAFASRSWDQRKKRTNGSKNIFVRKTLCETTPSSVSAK